MRWLVFLVLTALTLSAQAFEAQLGPFHLDPGESWIWGEDLEDIEVHYQVRLLDPAQGLELGFRLQSGGVGYWVVLKEGLAEIQHFNGRIGSSIQRRRELTLGQDLDLRVSLRGDQIEVLMGGEVILSRLDRAQRAAKGRLGLRSPGGMEVIAVQIQGTRAGITPASGRLIPMPQKLQDLEAVFPLGQIRWQVGGGVDPLGLQRFQTEYGLTDNSEGLPFIIGTVQDWGEALGLVDEIPQNLEGYYLEVTGDQVILLGRSPIGTYWGLQTLRQLVEETPDGLVLVGARISDYPDYAYRGITDDISRGPITTLEYMKEIVRQISAYKLNIYSPYMELHVLEGIGRPGEVLTKADYQELVAYAQGYHVHVIPSIQTFGHSRDFLAMREYAHFGNLPRGSVQLDPTNPEVYAFLDQVLGEWAAITESPYININCDEAWELGEGASGRLAKEIGEGEVYIQHLLRVIEIVGSHGKIPLFWGDMMLSHPELIPRVPQEAVVLNWHYMESGSMPARLKPFQSAGLTQWVAPGISNWMNIFPAYSHSLENVREFARIGLAHGATGILTTTWDDDGETLFAPNWYGVIYAAEASWLGGRVSEFDRRFDKAVFGVEGVVANAIGILSAAQPYTYVNYYLAGNELFHRNPFQDLTIYKLSGSQILLETEKAVLSMVQDSQVRANEAFLESLVLAARRMGALGRKIALTQEIIDSAQALEGGDGRELARLAGELEALAEEIGELSQAFSRLWLLENSSYSLTGVTRRYQNLRGALLLMAEELRSVANWGVVPPVEVMGLPRVR